MTTIYCIHVFVLLDELVHFDNTLLYFSTLQVRCCKLVFAFISPRTGSGYCTSVTWCMWNIS